MRFGSDIWAGNEMLAVAENVGRFDASRVRRVEFSSDQEILRALRNDVIESGALMLDEALVAQQDGTDLVVLAAVDSSVGSDAIMGRSFVHTLADLKGRRVGMQINSGGLQVLRRALSSVQLTVADISVINVPPERHVSAFASGEVDAVVTYDPMRMQLSLRGAVDLYNSTAIAGDVINVLVVRRPYLASHPDHARALLDAWWAGVEEFKGSPAARRWAARRLDLTPADLDRAFTTIELFDRARSQTMISGPSAPLLATAKRFHGFMRENGRLTQDIPVEDLFRMPAGWHE